MTRTVIMHSVDGKLLVADRNGKSLDREPVDVLRRNPSADVVVFGVSEWLDHFESDRDRRLAWRVIREYRLVDLEIVDGSDRSQLDYRKEHAERLRKFLDRERKKSPGLPENSAEILAWYWDVELFRDPDADDVQPFEPEGESNRGRRKRLEKEKPTSRRLKVDRSRHGLDVLVRTVMSTSEETWRAKVDVFGLDDLREKALQEFRNASKDLPEKARGLFHVDREGIVLLSKQNFPETVPKDMSKSIKELAEIRDRMGWQHRPKKRSDDRGKLSNHSRDWGVWCRADEVLSSWRRLEESASCLRFADSEGTKAAVSEIVPWLRPADQAFAAIRRLGVPVIRPRPVFKNSSLPYGDL